MNLPVNRLCTILVITMVLFGCSKAPQEQVDEYMRFYYPAKTESYYSIIFDWGRYEIIPTDPVGSDVHEDSKPYLGYITMRPFIKTPPADFKPAIYVITSKGVVWSIGSDTDIPKDKQRNEVVVKKDKYGTATRTKTLTVPNEPIIDHFKTNPGAWQKYGTLKATGGTFSELTLAK